MAGHCFQTYFRVFHIDGTAHFYRTPEEKVFSQMHYNSVVVKFDVHFLPLMVGQLAVVHLKGGGGGMISDVHHTIEQEQDMKKHFEEIDLQK